LSVGLQQGMVSIKVTMNTVGCEALPL